MISSREEKKEAIRQYKERKPARGIYAVRCSASSRIWVGSSKNLDASRNSTWFSLKLGSHHDKTLQAEWNTHGESAFEYEVLERLKDDVAPLSVPDILKEKKLHWMNHWNAGGLL